MTGAAAPRSIPLKALPGLYGIVRLGHADAVPDWFAGSGLTAAVRTDDELTLACRQDRIPDGLETDRNWRCFRSVGPFAFDTPGVVLSLIGPLSTAGVGVFVLCTFDGEHILVPDKDWARATRLLETAGHVFST